MSWANYTCIAEAVSAVDVVGVGVVGGAVVAGRQKTKVQTHAKHTLVKIKALNHLGDKADLRASIASFLARQTLLVHGQEI